MATEKAWKNPRVISLQSIARQEREKLVIRPFEQEDVTAHGHDCFELVYVTGGTAVQNINGVKESVRAGDYYIIDRGSMHAYQNSKQFTLINCLFLPEIIRWQPMNMMQTPKPGNPSPRPRQIPWVLLRPSRKIPPTVPPILSTKPDGCRIRVSLIPSIRFLS